jgi:hypothetical protein
MSCHIQRRSTKNQRVFNENAALLPELETLNQKRDFVATSLEELYNF